MGGHACYALQACMPPGHTCPQAYTPPGHACPPGMHVPQTCTPPWSCTPPQACTPSGYIHPPGTHATPRWILRDVLNERAVCILLECILVARLFISIFVVPPLRKNLSKFVLFQGNRKVLNNGDL